MPNNVERAGITLFEIRETIIHHTTDRTGEVREHSNGHSIGRTFTEESGARICPDKLFKLVVNLGFSLTHIEARKDRRTRRGCPGSLQTPEGRKVGNVFKCKFRPT
ncbi:hypothetical protein PMES_03247 [Profundibacterium mesophilum KAUST100406-0324]|uniref:Uncharacterized protein n=1 Tax=Profundibacterium mesophilum KAUST100406-0324 TaxID=1037889 RepID=A0A921NQX4_9RHOB|nr:hypothetical protein PMES_03247 [Profundibacterium mesophilum KAUST100406-0324]